ncbi:MAG: hypothetical protein UV61_C0005G0065 [Candidatus Gottesmanbacteria bacterium GW2011_GWB1_43_11]|uniref:Uncharacterized protein n=1 Tax=Candidatus Gottesmanbacteria bacterium GW2011_GWB1_43_11 TaxID=1618446 RepID=A0A0G1CNB3_9BACT|nr:MAG: hypothetical protein UV04_C0008G0023 [Candidatus Gottesmanbacteria bacterium GW2011_GWA2_42_16]KKS87044.1 MAG: hypothetical protein UV61_C0005G0065 [Candidatus Gottesmanbacteria bacterium GW2011_GWB1_43_11]OGG07572.1 MAG: hypothetical protein A2699_04910 [Candidatus Gottesmanbacteria bacterium RIFCSPHIGHO2_01_FULL_43_15]HCM38178.1 hypothetical protein [Patescibacteria group bacterium]
MDLTCSAHSDTIGYTKEAHMSVKDRSPVGVDGNPSKPLIPGIGSPLDLRGETVFDHPYKPRFDALPGTAPGGTVRPGLPAQPSEPSLQTKRRKALFQFAALTGAVAAGTGIGLALAGNKPGTAGSRPNAPGVTPSVPATYPVKDAAPVTPPPTVINSPGNIPTQPIAEDPTNIPPESGIKIPDYYGFGPARVTQVISESAEINPADLKSPYVRRQKDFTGAFGVLGAVGVENLILQRYDVEEVKTYSGKTFMQVKLLLGYLNSDGKPNTIEVGVRSWLSLVNTGGGFYYIKRDYFPFNVGDGVILYLHHKTSTNSTSKARLQTWSNGLAYNDQWMHDAGLANLGEFGDTVLTVDNIRARLQKPQSSFGSGEVWAWGMEKVVDR